ncbi:MAG: OmcA/MtrC family decaheme c-type cytochrome [Rubrivivax sp.]|nr:OmcA/MtrC family decaheme c-type cytochrome [Rubrivivax sp.]
MARKIPHSRHGLLGLCLVALLALSGCGGGDGAAGPAGPTGPAGPAGPAGPTGPGGSGGAGVVAVGSNSLTNASAVAANAAAWAALEPTVTVTGVTINSAPVVSFTVQDGFGRPVVGLGNTTKSATAKFASYPNLAFSLAKLVPGSNGSPSKWVSYIVTTVETNTAVPAPTRPSTDNTGTLVDNGDGSYKYTFYRDVTAIKDQVAAMTVTGTNNKADLGDLSYNANLTHRLTIQLSGNAPSTGTNTPTGANLGVTAVPMKVPFDAIYDFIPATGKAVTAADYQRDITANAKCEECHRKLGGIPGASAEAVSAGFHGGSRNNVQYCVVCHTEQRRYGRAEATASSINGVVKTFTGSTYMLDGRTIGDLPNFIHKTHLGEMLANKNYNYGGVLFNEVKYPQDVRNCTKCHDGSDTSTAKTLQGNNWKNAPSVKACGACHDGINFATGTGVKMSDAMKGLTSSAFAHPVGPQADDSMCTLCHKSDSIDLYHLPVTPPNLASALHVVGGNANSNAAWIASNTARLPPGAIKVTNDVKSVSRNAGKQPVMVFRMLQNGARKDLNANTAAELWDNFVGAPSVYFVFAVPQDGIAAPADFNASASVYLKTLWKGTGTLAQAGTLTGPDADGYYTATLTGVTIPDSAKMLTGGLGYSYNVTSALPLTQTNVAGYPVTPSPIAHASGNPVGGLIVIAPNVQRVAAGYTGRRAIVEDARCNACHQELGAFTEEAFHGGQRNDGTTCSWCHTPNRTSSGWSADSSSFVHAIHAAARRTVEYNWHAISATEGFWKVGYPGVLNQCETCHLPGTYDFSATASAAAVDNRQYRTVASGTVADNFSKSPYVAPGAYGAGFSFSAATGATTEAAATTLVTSPIATACFACHDSMNAESHFMINGGSIYAPRATALGSTETCLVCHGPGRIASIKESHAK